VGRLFVVTPETEGTDLIHLNAFKCLS